MTADKTTADSQVPDEQMALAALQKVQSMSAVELDARINQDIGEPMLGVLKAIGRALAAQDESDDSVARRVHGMVLAYLLAGEVRQ